MFSFIHMAAALSASKSNSSEGNNHKDNKEKQITDATTNLHVEINQHNQDINTIYPVGSCDTDAIIKRASENSNTEYHVNNKDHTLEDHVLKCQTLESQVLYSAELVNSLSPTTVTHNILKETGTDWTGGVSSVNVNIIEHPELDGLQDSCKGSCKDEFKDNNNVQCEIYLDNTTNKIVKDIEPVIVEDITADGKVGNDIAVNSIQAEYPKKLDILTQETETQYQKEIKYNNSKDSYNRNVTEYNISEDYIMQNINHRDCSKLEHNLGLSTEQQNLMISETRDEIDGELSPSLIFASCRYRWEKTIVTQSQSVVFVTLNKKGVEPVKLNWSENVKCFYSDEYKIPVGVHIGNLVIDGTFYPVEDITVKHYTFEVDLYLKDDILEDEGKGLGLTQVEEFKKQNHTNGQKEIYELNLNNQTVQSEIETDRSRTQTPITYYTYPVARAKMEGEAAQSDGSIHLSSKYEELVRSQMNSNKSALSDHESETEAKSFVQSEFPDLDGRGIPVGEDESKQYHDHDDDNNALKSSEYGRDFNSAMDFKEHNHFKDYFPDEYNDKISIHSSSSILNGSLSMGYKTPPTVIDDVLGNGHRRTPIYSTESPIHSKNYSSHISARQMPLAAESYDMSRPDSVGSATYQHSGNSAGIHTIDDLLNDSLSYDRKSPASETRNKDIYVSPGSATTTAVVEPLTSHPRSSPITNKQSINDLIEAAFGDRGSPVWNQTQEDSTDRQQLHTPPPTPEQIGDVLNPADRHSPIRRNIFSASLNPPNQSNQNSPHDSGPRSHVSSSSRSNGSSRHQTPQHELISSALHSSQEKLYSAQEMKQSSESKHGSQTGSRPASSSSRQDYGINTLGSQNGSRPESLTSEQELSQYYLPSEIDQKTTVNGNFSSTVARSSSVSSLPVIGSQRYATTKRSITPDNHIRVPTVPAGSLVKGPLLPNKKTSPQTPMSSASSRTVTPVTMETELEGRLREQIKDLESTVSSIRNVLTVREQQVDELQRQLSDVKDINKKLKLDLDHVQKQPSPGPQLLEMEKKYQDVCKEKELLNSEITRLRLELLHNIEPSLNSFNPNNPKTLQHKIDDLNSHIQDLQEANETAVEEIHAAEKRVKELAADNEALRTTQSERFREIEDDNRHLKSEILMLKESQVCHTEATDYRLRIELQQVKEDSRSLRERNYQLHDENLKLNEELSNLRKSDEMVDKLKKSSKDVKTLPISDSFNKNADRDKLVESSYDSDVGYVASRTSDPVKERRADIGFERYNYSTVGYETNTKYNKNEDTTRSDTNSDTEQLLKTEAARYERYRTKPDGRSAEKYLSSHAYSQPLTPERPSALTKNEITHARTSDRNKDIELSLVNRARHRTTSAELDLRSNPVINYDKEWSVTTPALSGRSREDNKQPVIEKAVDLYSRRDISDRHHIQQSGKDAQVADLTTSIKSFMSPYQDDGNTSDTPTDILVNTQPVDKIHSSSWNKGHQRLNSFGSDASNSSFSDIDNQLTSSARKRSKSADGREILRRIWQNGSAEKGEKNMARTLSPPPSAGMRSVTPRPLVTQHNKIGLSLTSSLNSLTQGLRPFAPRSAGDLQINDVIKFSRQGGKLSQGTIKFIGHLPGRGDIYLGVELDKEDGKHDGVFEGIRYFKCKPNKGVFVAYNKVVMAWSSY